MTDQDFNITNTIPDRVPSLFTQVLRASPHEQQLQIYLDFIKILKESDPSRPDDFVVNYLKTREPVSKRSAPGMPIQEQLGRELSVLNCLNYLIHVYPHQNITIEDAKKCQEIFKILVKNATYIGLEDDCLEVYYTRYRKPGVFSIKRKTVADAIFNTAKILYIPCADCTDEICEPAFHLHELLDSEKNYQIFLAFWTNLHKAD